MHISTNIKKGNTILKNKHEYDKSFIFTIICNDTGVKWELQIKIISKILLDVINC